MGPLLAAWLLLFQSPPESTLLLAQIQTHMRGVLSHQPNYTCTETVERSRRRVTSRRFDLQDTLRIEVAIVDGKEMFAWPGSKNFEDVDIRKFVTTGTFGNGNFAMHARSVFASNIPTFEYRGEWPLGEKTAIRYDFRVPKLLSGYSINVGDAQAVVGYHGSFYVNPDTLDVASLEVVPDDIPAELGLAAASDRMEYSRTRIGSADFLLPSGSELTMRRLDGEESHNRVRFTSCREFQGESVLRLDDPIETDTTVAKQIVAVPGGVDVDLALKDDIELSNAAVGDPVLAELRRDIRMGKEVLFAKGTLVKGRIARLERTGDSLTVGFVFTEMESASKQAFVDLIFDRAINFDSLTPRRGLLLPVASRPQEGLLYLKPGAKRLIRGILMYWRT